VAQVAASQWSILSVDELLECGLTRHQIARRRSRATLHRIYRSVYAVGHSALSMQGRFLAAVKACGRAAVLSHYSAAALWRMVKWDDRFPEVTVAGEGTRSHRGIRIHRTRRLESADIRTCDGIPATSPARTVLDLAGRLPERALRRLTRNAISERVLTVNELLDVLDRHPRRRGSRKLRRILAGTAPPTRSVLEDRAHDLLVANGLRPPCVNVGMTVEGMWVIPDFRWPVERVIVEADGAAWHDHKLAREDDARRQALLEAHGEAVLRITWADVVERPDETVRRVRATLARRVVPRIAA
jgi:hypothetical protein